MGRAGIGLGVFVAGLLAGLPAVAQEGPGAGTVAIGVARDCLRLADAAFEQSLDPALSDADRALLEGVVSAATFECLGLSMEICERQGEGTACLDDLTEWTRETRVEIVVELPDAFESETPARADAYARALEFAEAPASDVACEEMTEAERARYCAVVSEGLALDDAYQAWRLARLEGAAPLVGHAPVDLEMLR